MPLKDTLLEAGLSPSLAEALNEMPHRNVHLDPRRPFREPGMPRNEVMFVTSGLISKYKTDSSGRRQIVALRFPGEGVLPREGNASYGIQAIVKSDVMIGKVEDFDKIVADNPELANFFWRLVQRNEFDRLRMDGQHRPSRLRPPASPICCAKPRPAMASTCIANR